jgi:lysozyme family protein
LTINLTSTLTQQYRDLWKTCEIRPKRAREVDQLVDRIVANKKRYKKAGNARGVPWHGVGVIHMLKRSGNFQTHRHVLERFNGWGYRRHDIDVPSPYLWSFSNHYTRGKFTKDRVFSPTTVSKQCGAAVLLKRMVERKLTKIQPASTPAPPALR